MDKKELLFALALKRIPGVGDITAKKLIAYFGSAEAVFTSNASKWEGLNSVKGFLQKEISKTLYLKEAEAELAFIAEQELKVFYYKDEAYPENLKHCIDAPFLFFGKGNLNFNNPRIISIVGTRKASWRAKEFCQNLVADLVPYKPLIVSGFAYGVDICAHQAAIENNLPTIACLAHGFKQLYPAAHKKYEAEMLYVGGFVSDFCSDAVFDRKNFLRRNRIIAGLSQATLVIESANKGGSLVTATIANSYNREVFAVPGHPTEILSEGCNNLIKTQQANLLTSVKDLVYMLNWDVEKNINKQPVLFPALSEKEQIIVDAIQKLGKALLDELALETQIPTYNLVGELLNLELKGVVKPLPGKKYELT